MPLFTKGQRVGSGSDADRWQIIRKLGEGQFAEVFEVRDTSKRDVDERYAMKVEKRPDMKSVKQEHRVMRKLAEVCPQICPVLHGGTLRKDERSYFVLQLLGSNLVDVRRACPGGRMEPRAVRLIGCAMLDALQAVHAAGFIHRDVKPANFAQVPGSPDVGEWRLLDFGLARRFVDESGGVLPARSEASFRGSTTYASIHAHAGEDQSRRDDLWSWMYCLAELAEGTLPWRQETREGAAEQQRTAVAAIKQLCVVNPDLLAPTTPMAGVCVTISGHLNQLKFEDAPDYGLLRQALAHLPDTWPTPEQQQQQQEVVGGAGSGIASPQELRHHLAPPHTWTHTSPPAPLHMNQAHHTTLELLPPPPPPANSSEAQAWGYAQHSQQAAMHVDLTLNALPPPPPPPLPPPDVQGYPQAPPPAGNLLPPGFSVSSHDAAHLHHHHQQQQYNQQYSQQQQQQQAWGGGPPCAAPGLDHTTPPLPGLSNTSIRLGQDGHTTPPYPQHPQHALHMAGTGQQGLDLGLGMSEREAAAVHSLCSYIEFMNAGAAGQQACMLAGQLAALHPADMMAVVASVLGSAVPSTPAESCNALAGLLRDVALFASAAAKQAGTKHAVWRQQQKQQQHLGMGVQTRAGDPHDPPPPR